MIPKELCFGQRIDPTNNLIEPWLVNDAMDVIKNWDLKNMKVLEYGAGLSTLWWADKCKEVVTIEAAEDWYLKMNAVKPANVDLHYRPCNEGNQSKIDFYTSLPTDFSPDIIVVDGILRYECIQKALTLPRPLILIVDNFMQAFVFMCPAAVDLLKDFPGTLYEQKNHTDHDGINKWKTGIWEIE